MVEMTDSGQRVQGICALHGRFHYDPAGERVCPDCAAAQVRYVVKMVRGTKRPYAVIDTYTNEVRYASNVKADATKSAADWNAK